MGIRRRGVWLWIALLLVVAAAAGSVAFVFSSPDRESAGALLQTFVVVITAAASCAAWLWTQSRTIRAVRLPLERAADELAEQLRRQWEQAAAERRLNYPSPIPLRWIWSSRPVSNPIEEVIPSSGGSRFVPLSGMLTVSVQDLQAGELKDLLKVYSGVDSGRLVILGGPGAGKSSAGIRLLLDALIHREQAGVTPSERARIPVPILTTLQGWNPVSEPLVIWLANRLVRDYELLRAPEYGRDVALRLVESGYLAVILDGLDEISKEVRPIALRALDEQATFRLVVLTRSEEFTAAVSDVHLQGAAVLELLPIDSNQAADYLMRCQIVPLSFSWQRVVDHLRKCPTGVLAQALDTPLMLSLIRDTYGRNEGVDELIDGNRFVTRGAIEDHLLDRVLPTVYKQRPGQPDPPYTLEQAQQWLGRLAQRMNEDDTRDLAWQQIPRWTPLWPRVLITVFVLFFVSVLLFVSVNQPHFPVYTIEPRARLVIYLGDALLGGLIFGFWLLFVSRSEERIPSWRSELQWSRNDRRVILLIAFTVGLVTGLQYKFGYGLGLGDGRVVSPLAAVLIGLMVTLVVGLGFLLSGGPPQQWGRLRWSSTWTPTNLVVGVIVGVVVGVTVGVGEWLVCGLPCGLVLGIAAGVGYGLVIAFNYGPSRGLDRLRWSRTVILMDLLIALIIGLVVGLVFGITYRYGLAVGLVTGILVALAVGFVFGFGKPSTVADVPIDPMSLWERESRFGILMGLVCGVMYGFAAGFAAKLMRPDYGLGYWLGYGLVQGPVVGLGVGLVSSLTWMTMLSSAQLHSRSEAPLRLMRFLGDAHARQILRTAGPVYQFRHARVQDRLARTQNFTASLRR